MHHFPEDYGKFGAYEINLHSSSKDSMDCLPSMLRNASLTTRNGDLRKDTRNCRAVHRVLQRIYSSASILHRHESVLERCTAPQDEQYLGSWRQEQRQLECIRGSNCPSILKAALTARTHYASLTTNTATYGSPSRRARCRLMMIIRVSVKSQQETTTSTDHSMILGITESCLSTRDSNGMREL